MSGIRRNRSLVAGALLAALSLLELGLLAAHIDAFWPVDDAYISFRYARNLAAGQGLVFNEGERVEGYSNFLWVVLVAVAHKAGVSPPIAARGLALAAAVATLLALLTEARGTRCLLPGALCAILLTTDPLLRDNLLSGLEAPLALFLLTLAVVALGEDRFYLGAAALFFLALTRPEGVVLGIILLSTVVLRQRHMNSRPRIPGRDSALSLVVFFALPFAVYTGWRVWYFHAWMPNALAAKSGLPPTDVLQASGRYLAQFALNHVPLLLGATIGLVRLGRPPLGETGRYALLAAGTLLLLNLWIGAGDPYLPYHRYLLPALPLLGLVAVSRTSSGELNWRLASNRRLSLSVLQIACVALQIILGSARMAAATDPSRILPGLRAIVARDDAPHPYPESGPRQGLHAEAALLSRLARPADVLASAEIGIAPYYSGVRVLDTFGLVNREIARAPGSPGAKAQPTLVLAARPRFIAIKVAQECLCEGIPSDVALMAQPAFRIGYDAVAAFQSRKRWILLFERRTEPLLGIVYDLIEQFSANKVGLQPVQPALPQGELGNAFAQTPGLVDLGQAENADDLRNRFLAFGNGVFQGAEPAERVRGHLALRKRVLTIHPGAHQSVVITYPLRLETPAALTFSVGMPRSHWNDHIPGDGVEFKVQVATAVSAPQVVFATYLDPKHDPVARHYPAFTIDLSAYTGKEVRLELITGAGLAQDDREDWGQWVEPLIVALDKLSSPDLTRRAW